MEISKVLKLKILKIDYWEWLYLFSLAIFLLDFVFYTTNQPYKSRFGVALALLISLLAFIVSQIEEVSRDRNLQLLHIYIVLALFWDLSLISNTTVKDYKVIILCGVLAFNIPVLILVARILGSVKYHMIRRGNLKRHWFICLVLLVFVLLSIETLDIWPRLDTDIYYHYLQLALNWNFSFDSLDLLRLGGHQCIAYSIFGLVGMFLTPYKMAGVLIVNLILWVVAISCFYKILQKLFPRLSCLTRGGLTAILAFNPLCLGIIYEINLDLPMTCFFIIVLWAFLYEKNIILAVTAMCLVFSKETGIILLFGLAVGWFLVKIGESVKVKKCLLLQDREIKRFISFVMPAVWFLTFQKAGMLWRQDSVSLSVSSSGMDNIGIHPSNIIIKTKELFCLNFNWILCIGVLIACVWGIKRLVSEERANVYRRIKDFLPIVMAMGCFVVFQYIYITYCHIRYIMPFIPCLIILFAVFISSLKNYKAQIWICGIISLLMLAQSFYTIDPMTLIVSNKINIGKTQLITTRTFVRGVNNEIRTEQTDPDLIPYLEMTQSAIYNRQFLYFEKAFEGVLSQIDYDDNTLILVAPIYEVVPDMTWVSLFGRWYDKNLYYDTSNGKITVDTRMDILNIQVLSEGIEVPYGEYNEIFLLTFPYNSLFDTEAFLEQYNIIDEFEYYYRFWEIDVHQLK